VVLDPSTGEYLLDRGAAEPRVPASTTKLVTAAAALAALGPDTRFTTSVIIPAGEVGEIVLVGGGDPALSRRVATDERWIYPITPLGQLASATAAELVAAGETTVRLGYASDLFQGPGINPLWEASYVGSGEVAPVAALSLDGGRRRPGFAARATDPALDAAQEFVRLLAVGGVRVAGSPIARATPSGTVLASIESPTVAEVVEQMLARSDNDVAEMLARHVALAEGFSPTFGGEAISAAVERLGVPVEGLVLADASGLARGNRLSASTIAGTLQAAFGDDRLSPMLTGLPIAGFSGTLGDRFTDPQSVPWAGDIRAKTGYLQGVVSLAGYVIADDGPPLIFAFLADAVPAASTLAAQLAMDQLAARLAGCGCG
jgi:D-alanyl-D-alanine carboxypeptidase/D-alanyl-D-alanine-endopeptidase (penicillin-binding protein 4)